MHVDISYIEFLGIYLSTFTPQNPSIRIPLFDMFFMNLHHKKCVQETRKVYTRWVPSSQKYGSKTPLFWGGGLYSPHLRIRIHGTGMFT